jgi:hypothetical protein
MTQAAGATVHQNHDLAQVEAKPLSKVRIKDFSHHLNFKKVIAGTQSSQLIMSTLFGPLTH